MTEIQDKENYVKLGTLLTRYAGITLTFGIIAGVFTFVASFTWLGSINSTTSEAELIDIFSSGMKTILYGAVVILIIDYVIMLFLLLGIHSLSKNSWEFQNSLQKVKLFFALNIGIGVVLVIYTIVNTSQTLNELYALIQNISTLTEQDLTDMTALLNTQSILSGILGLIPTVFNLAAYFKLAEIGSILLTRFPSNPGAQKTEKGFRFLKIGLILGVVSNVMGLIPNMPLVGLVSFVGAILLYVGLFMAGGGLKAFSPVPYNQAAPIYPGYGSQSPAYGQPMPPSNTNLKTEIAYSEALNTIKPTVGKICPLCGFREPSSDAKFCSSCGNHF